MEYIRKSVLVQDDYRKVIKWWNFYGKMNLQKLRQIGLSEGEIKVYEALLDLGESTKTNLAKKSGIAPSNIYDVTNRLFEKGLISKIEKNGVAHFSPASPKHLLNYLKDKEREIEEERGVVNKLMPSLMADFEKVKENQNAEVFYGWNGLKTVFEDMIDECEKGDKNFVFGASAGENDEQSDRFFVKYSKLREEKGIQTFIIFNQELRKRKKRIEYFLKSKKYKVKFLDQSTPAEMMLYRNKACMIIMTKEPLVVRITSSEVVNSFLEHFKILWKSARD